MNTEYLFVYGTLMSATNSEMYQALIKPFFTYLGKGSVQGELYDLGEYPGLVASDNTISKVKGEVFSFNADQVSLLTLDEYEGCDALSPQPHEYLRMKTLVTMDDNSSLVAWSYFYQGSLNNAERIISGKYLG